jgi:hypothetical protein
VENPHKKSAIQAQNNKKGRKNHTQSSMLYKYVFKNLCFSSLERNSDPPLRIHSSLVCDSTILKNEGIFLSGLIWFIFHLLEKIKNGQVYINTILQLCDYCLAFMLQDTEILELPAHCWC